MAFKFLSLCALLAVARAGVVSYEPQPAYYSHAAPVAYAAQPAVKVVQSSPLVHATPVVHASPIVKSFVQPAAVVAHHQPAIVTKVAQPVVAKVSHEDYDPNPQYSFNYAIEDSLTGDSKSQQETRNGDVVEGHYSLVDPDGVKRTVHYTADPVHGFNAQVQREPLVHKAVVSQPIVKTVVAQPTVVKAVHAPIVHAAPVHAYHH
ncbi:hypothetical protein PVAND_011871 [Polypedilum vanderplanki]|uniref:Cuticle protein n=1 Tax=Polypedilum vanderplanki TaxID=319348 RepID=A0A9J6CLJ9_POLVA|nr:hypothetical protein PVAND_011871 [Polypedilum vanderplanki]